MDINEVLKSKSAPRIKKAAENILKDHLAGHESQLIEASNYLLSKPKSWQAHSKVIRALGISGAKEALSHLKQLLSYDFDSTILYIDLGFSICSIVGVEYLKSILNTDNHSLLSGACSAILYNHITPDNESISKILTSIVSYDVNEGRIITPRCYIAAACYSWPMEVKEDFLYKCMESSWPTLVEISKDSLSGRKTKYTLV